MPHALYLLLSSHGTFLRHCISSELASKALQEFNLIFWVGLQEFKKKKFVKTSMVLREL